MFELTDDEVATLVSYSVIFGWGQLGAPDKILEIAGMGGNSR
jgi:hypothetical protein